MRLQMGARLPFAKGHGRLQLNASEASSDQAYRSISQDISAPKRHKAPGAQSREPHSPVREIMTRNVVTFAQDVPIEAATQTMLHKRISGAPVVDDHGKPIGIVSKTDLLEAWHEHDKAKQRGEAVDGPSGTVVGDIMVPYLLAAQDSSPISLAAALMAYEGVHRLLVLNEDQQMVGIVSTLDVLRWLAQLSGFCVPHRS